MDEKKRGCLFGFFLAFGLIFLTLAVFIGVVVLKGKDIAAFTLEKSKETIFSSLSDEHSEAQVEKFKKVFNTVVKDISELGVQEGAIKYKDMIQDLAVITRDGIITIEESSRWVKEFAEIKAKEK